MVVERALGFGFRPTWVQTQTVDKSLNPFLFFFFKGNNLYFTFARKHFDKKFQFKQRRVGRVLILCEVQNGA